MAINRYTETGHVPRAWIDPGTPHHPVQHYIQYIVSGTRRTTVISMMPKGILAVGAKGGPSRRNGSLAGAALFAYTPATVRMDFRETSAQFIEMDFYGLAGLTKSEYETIWVRITNAVSDAVGHDEAQTSRSDGKVIEYRRLWKAVDVGLELHGEYSSSGAGEIKLLIGVPHVPAVHDPLNCLF
jgi:hypothetical protein